MTSLLRDFRLIPIVLMAIICLFVLKTFGLVFDGGYTLGEAATRNAEDREATGSISAPRRIEAAPAESPKAPTPMKRSWAQEMLNFPDITGAVGEDKPPPPPADAAAKDNRPVAPTSAPAPAPVPPGAAQGARERPLSAAERAILERLGERREELEVRARELEMRENLLTVAEKRLEARITELKELEARVTTASQTRSEGEVAQLKNLVTMYENMKAKDAAKIFDRLDMRVLIEVATQLNPRRMSDILAQMSPEAAERLTVELAGRAKDRSTPAELPKIEGWSGTN
jgi:flagellar motility protein MotE (MotC chaperone)